MGKSGRRIAFCIATVFLAAPTFADTAKNAATAHLADEAKNRSTESADFTDEDSFLDLSDAMRSKQYVHRAILNSLVQETNRIAVSRFFISHMMGYNAIWQRGANYSKFSSGLLGVSAGWISSWGHGFELGGEISQVSNVFFAYKYYIRPKDFSLWPFLGAGVGTELSGLSFADGPPEAQNYSGTKQMGFATLGVLVPAVDVAFKAEVRLNFYGGDRAIFTSGVGIILFL